jgi:phosphatidylserine decarboxylase
VNVTTKLVSARWRILIAMLARLPQGGLSRITGRVARLTIPRPLRAPLLGAFARSLGAAIDEAERPLLEYRSLDEFFVRRLRPGVREWPCDPDVVASPVDGVIGEFGRIESGQALQAKGRHYSLAQLLDSPDWARYEGGDFITFYLSPRHYHRVHAPVSGRVPHTHWIPGALMPVNLAAIELVDDLFPRNERVVCWLEDSAAGSIAVVAVGAFNVGRITAAFDPDVSTNAPRASARTRTYESPIRVQQGDEILAFHLGSTVILLFEPGRIAWKDSVENGREIRLGQAIASLR